MSAQHAEQAQTKQRRMLTPIGSVGDPTSQFPNSPISRSSLWLIPILLVAFFFRIYDLGHTPLGAHYDEAANAILTDEIAHGARPIFIRAYTGKEVGYFYLAAIFVRLIGQL